MDISPSSRFYGVVRQVLQSLRLRFHECQRTDASLESWHALQLEILGVAKTLRRQCAEREYATTLPSSAAESRVALWALLGEAFWVERDLLRLTCMIEDVIAAIEAEVAALERGDH
jgi:hypothetical protein